ncbi:hypothetical protein LCGC14_2134120, partial [marine sediment metagenome]
MFIVGAAKQAEDIAASIAGGIAGGLIAGPVGAVLGSLLGMAFVDTVETEAGTIAGALRAQLSEEFGLVPDEPKDDGRRGISDIEADIIAIIDRVITQTMGPKIIAEQVSIPRTKEGVEAFIGKGELSEVEFERQF